MIFAFVPSTFEMCQLWVNLPKKDKLTAPTYQPIVNKDIPIVKLPLGGGEEDLGHVRVIAGSFGDTSGAATTFSPVELWDVILPQKGKDVDLPFPADQNCIIFVRDGGVDMISDNGKKVETVGPQSVALMHMNSGDVLRLRPVQKDTKVLIMGGKMLNEPIANRGPFVMNTQEELVQAQRDYYSGNLGR